MAVGRVARSHHGATLQCGGVQGGGGEAHGWKRCGQGEHGGVSGTVAPWRDPTLLQRTGLLVWGGCRVAAVRRTGLLAWGGCMVF